MDPLTRSLIAPLQSLAKMHRRPRAMQRGKVARARIYVSQPIAAAALERLRKVAEVAVNPDSSAVLCKKDLCASVRDADILVSLLHDRVDKDVLAANPNLWAVTSMAITPDNIDVAEATRRGIPVTVVPPLVTEATADICIGLMLAVARRIVEGDALARRGGFPGSQSSHLIGPGVTGKVLGLVGGAGRIGRAVARRAQGFDMKVLYWSPRRRTREYEKEHGLVYATLDKLLRDSDFISLHAPMRPETHHLIGARELKLMKPTAILINTARGPIVDEEALARALEQRRIGGAGLDVFEHEPRIPPALRKLSNVVLTPHLGSAVVEVRAAMANVVVDNVLAILAGRRPPNCVNPEIYGE